MSIDQLEQLYKEFEDVKTEILFMEYSDDYCYSNRKIYPLLDRKQELAIKILDLEAMMEGVHDVR